jgi:hypothetical protein
MNSIRLIYFLSIIATFVFLGSSVALIVSFIIGHQLHEFVPQFILWGTTKWVILGGAIACLLFAIANIVMWSMLRRLQSSKKSKMVGELMYILGLRYEQEVEGRRSITWATSILSVKEIPVVGRGLSRTEKEIAKKRKINKANLAYKHKDTISVTPAPRVVNPNPTPAKETMEHTNSAECTAEQITAAAEYMSFINKQSSYMEVETQEGKSSRKRRCHTCKKTITEDKFSMSCDENQRHIYCFLCCKISLEQQGSTAYCPSGNKCNATGTTEPWIWDPETWKFEYFNTYEDQMEEVDYLHSILMNEEEKKNKNKPPAEKNTFASIIGDNIDRGEAMKEDATSSKVPKSKKRLELWP